jgi:phosphatidate cytidylyltransferase
LAPPALLAVHLGSPLFSVLVVACSGIAGWEWGRICGAPADEAAPWLLIVVLLAATACAAFIDADAALVVLMAGLGAVWLAGRAPSARWLALGVLYVGLPGIALIWLRDRPEYGEITLFWLLAVVWASDSGAFLVGSALGGPKLAARISPNKTWSGAIGGLALAMAAGMAVALISGVGSPLRVGAISFAVAIAAQAGDLMESAIKRRFGVKDMSGLIPGHGGLLDRVDALLLASVVTALIVVLGNGRIWIWD